VYYALEAAIGEVWVVNAHHVKNVPGRKTDLSDAEWLADVLNLPFRADTPQRRRRAGGLVTRSQGFGCPRGSLMAQPSELSTGAARGH